MNNKRNINFNDIREIDGDVKKGFEEFVCQLARFEEIEGKKKFNKMYFYA